MPKQPTKLTEAVHIDDFMDLKRRVGAVESKHGDLESTMKELNEKITSVNRAIMGDISNPDQPGMAENMRTLTRDVSNLVKMHHKEIAENKIKASQESSSKVESLPWKTILLALGIIGSLVGVIIKLIPLISNGGL